MCLRAEVLSEIKGNYVLNPPGDADQCLLPREEQTKEAAPGQVFGFLVGPSRGIL